MLNSTTTAVQYSVYAGAIEKEDIEIQYLIPNDGNVTYISNVFRQRDSLSKVVTYTRDLKIRASALAIAIATPRISICT